MNKIKYKLKFYFSNLDKSELRNLKIDSLSTNDVLEFETINVSPRVPEIGEIFKITNRAFRVIEINNQYQQHVNFITHVIDITLLDVQKENERLKKIQDEEKKVKHSMIDDLIEKEKRRTQYRDKSIYEYFDRYDKDLDLYAKYILGA